MNSPKSLCPTLDHHFSETCCGLLNNLTIQLSNYCPNAWETVSLHARAQNEDKQRRTEVGSGTTAFRTSVDHSFFPCAWAVESATGSKIVEGQSFGATTLRENKLRIDYKS